VPRWQKQSRAFLEEVIIMNRWKYAVLLVVLVASACSSGPAPETILLWPDGAPDAVGETEEDTPTLTVYLPRADRATGTGVVVCPGGGYATHAMDHEGRQVADWLNRRGVAAFVLQYRVGPRYRHPAPLRDAHRAIRTARARAAAWGVAPDRIGIWGFSAGGHLAATAGTHVEAGHAQAADAGDRESTRPDFLILAYPVISMTEAYTHAGSRTHLLGEAPDSALAVLLSNEKQVTAETPPTFLFHTNEDEGVPAENSVAFYLALREAGVPAELHIYEHGRHGVGLAPDDPVLSTWADRLEDWMRRRGLLDPSTAPAMPDTTASS
jgi:acetyl esterase/lipase